MINLVEFIHEKLMETNHGKELISYIEQNTDKNVLEYINDILSEFFDNDDPNKVISYTRNRKLMRRKVDWYEKATTGYRDYLNTGKVKRGIYRHIVDFIDEVEVMQKENGPLYRMANALSPEETLNNALKTLEEWIESDDSLLIQYPFFYQFGDKLKQKSLEVDAIILIGESFIKIIKQQEHLLLKNDVVGERVHQIGDETYYKEYPSILLEMPLSAIGSKGKYKIKHDDPLDTIKGRLVKVEKKYKHELPEGVEVYVEEGINTKGKNKIKTPDFSDEMLFIEMLEHRDENFQKNKQIFIYLSDLIDTFYESDSKKTYDLLKERLWNLGHFRIVKTFDNGAFRIRSLFQSLDVEQDKQGRWYVFGVVSDQIHDAILRDNFIRIYSEKINELSSPLAIHISFLVQKERILHHIKGKDMITFRLHWTDFQRSIRMNKRSKNENMKEIAKALSEIKEKEFLIHSFYRDSASSFLVNCYNLNDHELKDRASIRSIFQQTTASKLLEGTIEEAK